jgi:uncharacterized delta-60 repeat protein
VESLETRRLFAAGALDTTFGSGGGVAVDYLGQNENVGDVLVQSDGKVLISGSTGDDITTGQHDFILARLNPDGSPDTSFGGGDGIAINDFGANDRVWSLALQADGKIIGAGGAGNGHFQVFRYNADGSFDTSFGEAGLVSLTIPNSNDYGAGGATAVAVRPDGKIVAVGPTGYGGGPIDQVVLRLNPDGTPDASFGAGDGVVVSHFTDYNFADAVLLTPDGKILVGGGQGAIFAGDASVTRYNADGTLDTTFGGGDGIATADYGWDERIHDMAFTNDGGVVAVGSLERTWNDDIQDMVIFRISADGTPKAGFGTQGKINQHWPPSLAVSENAWGVVVNAGGTIIVSASLGIDVGLVAYNPTTGARDTSFGSNGFVTSRLPMWTDGHGVALQADGRLVVGGHYVLPEPREIDLGAWRFLGASTPLTARAGGPYSVDEGGRITLRGDASGNADVPITTFEWDLDYDGTTFDVDASGSAPVFSAAGIDGPATRTAGFRVRDANGNVSNVSTATITIRNAAPVVVLADPNPANPVPFQAVKFNATFTDPAPEDRLEVAWDFGDGATVPFHPAPSGGDAPTHAYQKPGEYTVTVTVRDDDGAATSRSLRVKVEPVAIQAAPCDPAQRWLAVGGTAGNDDITFSPQGHSGVRVTLNGRRSAPFSDISRIFAFGGPGRDSISVSAGIRAPALLDGGDGSDRLTGGGGDDVLLGGPGNDVLVGRQGRDTLVGGMGYDQLLGNRQSTRIEGDADVNVTCGGVTVTPVRRRMGDRDGSLLAPAPQ